MGVEIKREEVELQEIQSVSVETVAKDKARKAYNNINKPVIVEDTGLYIEDLNGFPGALSKLVSETFGYDKLCEIIGENRNARAKTTIAYCDKNELRTFSGEIKGRISKEPRGEDSFGWDTIFIPKGYQKTYAELGHKKHKISMRKKAIKKLEVFLRAKI